MFDTQNTVDVSIISVGDCQGGQSGPTPQVWTNITQESIFFSLICMFSRIFYHNSFRKKLGSKVKIPLTFDFEFEIRF